MNMHFLIKFSFNYYQDIYIKIQYNSDTVLLVDNEINMDEINMNTSK